MAPRIKPNDGLKIDWKPPFPPAKTGKPIKPKIMYRIIDKAPFTGPSKAGISKKKKTCKVMGTGQSGMTRMDEIASKAVNKAIKLMSRVVKINDSFSNVLLNYTRS